MKSAKADKRDKQKNTRKPPGTATPPPSRDSAGHVADDEGDPSDITDQKAKRGSAGGTGDDRSKKKRLSHSKKKKQSFANDPNPDGVHLRRSSGGGGDAPALRPPIIKNLWQACRDEVAAELQDANETMRKMGLPSLNYTKDRRYPYSDYDGENYPHPQTCKVKDFLDFYVFPTLLPGIKSLIKFGKESRAFGDPYRPFNALDFIVDYIYNNNPRCPDRQESPTPLLEIPFVKEWMSKYPRTSFPKWMHMSQDQAATIIQSVVRGFLARVRPEIQSLRDDWRDRKRKKEEEKHLLEAKRTSRIPRHSRYSRDSRGSGSHPPHSAETSVFPEIKSEDAPAPTQMEDAETATEVKYSDPCLAIAFDYLYNNKVQKHVEVTHVAHHDHDPTHPEDAPRQKSVGKYPRSPFPKWVFITDDDAARVIQKAYRGYQTRNRPEIHKWRGIWKEYKLMLEAEAEAEAEEEAAAAAAAAAEELKRKEDARMEAGRLFLEEALSQYEDIDFPSTSTNDVSQLSHSQTCDVCYKFRQWFARENQGGHCLPDPSLLDPHHEHPEHAEHLGEEEYPETEGEIEDPFEDNEEGEEGAHAAASTMSSILPSGHPIHESKSSRKKRSGGGSRGSKSKAGKLSNPSTTSTKHGSKWRLAHGVSKTSHKSRADPS